MLGLKAEKIEVADMDIRNYTKYILRDGSNLEKRELLGCINSKLVLQQKVLTLEGKQ